MSPMDKMSDLEMLVDLLNTGVLGCRDWCQTHAEPAELAGPGSVARMVRCTCGHLVLRDEVVRRQQAKSTPVVNPAPPQAPFSDAVDAERMKDPYLELWP